MRDAPVKGGVARRAAAFAVVAALAIFPPAACSSSPGEVAVFLPLTGPSALPWSRGLELAEDTLARRGARVPALRFVDSAVGDPVAAARALASDPRVLAVIGPDSSSLAFAIAPVFDAARKPLVSPSATSADLGRAYFGRGTFWRTVESDLAQTRVLLERVAKDGATRVALLTTFDPYGATFFDAFGFHAAELGLTVTAARRTPLDGAGCDAAVAAIAASGADAIVVAPPTVEGVLCTARAAAVAASRPRLYYPDVARVPAVTALGALAEGITVSAPAASAASGFDAAFRARFGEDPPAYAASTHDALLLAGLALAASRGEGGEALLAALPRVAGAADVAGATGPLDYDPDGFTDPVSSTYAVARVKGGAFQELERVDTAGMARARPGAGAKRAAASDPTIAAPPRAGLWAVLVAASVGWDSYRHQADVLAHYQRLRARGVPDDHIVLVAENDLAASPANTERGVVRNAVGGPDVLAGAQIDYPVRALAASDVVAILSGAPSVRAPRVLEAGAGDDLLVLLAGHGGREGLFLHADGPSFAPTDAEIVSPAALATALGARAAAGGFRRALVAVEMCHAGVMGEALEAAAVPRVALLAGALPAENSVAAQYDVALGQWRADAFALALLDVAGRADLDLVAAYDELYGRVSASHVALYNSARFGAASEVTVESFYAP